MKTEPKKKDNYYILGLTLVIIGYIGCLNPYWWIFGPPIILLGGIILSWFSKKTKLYKILISILPIILWFPGMFLLTYFGTNRMSPETFLIPENFRGKIILYYDEPCGQEVKDVDGRLIYNIPKNGIMVLKNKFETGIIDDEYYFVDRDGKKKQKLKILIQQDFNEDYTLEKNKHEPPRNQVAIFWGGTGTQGMTNGKELRSHSMYVGSWDSLRVSNDQKNYDSGLNLVQSCRINSKQ